MAPERIDELIRYRNEKSRITLEDARIAIENKRFLNASNRIYYAIFYIVSALALTKNFFTSKHVQLLGWFNQNFVNSGIVSKELGKIYSNAFEFRQESDYDDFVTFEESEIHTRYTEANLFVNEIEKLLHP